MFEVKETITKIMESYPIHIGNTIIHLSKLLLGEFVTFLEKFLINDNFRFLYTGRYNILRTHFNIILDTDSLAVCMTGEMDDIIKPELKTEWETAKKTWFVQDEQDAYETRLPGLMKSEWKTQNGALVA